MFDELVLSCTAILLGTLRPEYENGDVNDWDAKHGRLRGDI